MLQRLLQILLLKIAIFSDHKMADLIKIGAKTFTML
jgi:hypothetical protein